MEIEQLSSYGIPQDYIEKFKLQGIQKLHDPQIKSIKKGVLESKNQIISAPTASGKTLIPTLAAIKKIMAGSKVIYLVPLVALASEKWEYYKNLFRGTGVRVAISTGDLDSSSQWLSEFDLIILTTEKCDSLMRHEAQWIKEVGLVVIDEIHLLQDTSRGPTLEITLTRLKESLPKAQFIGLSATIRNLDEIATWLDSIPIKSDFRPVVLHEGVFFDYKIHFFGREGYNLSQRLPLEQSILENAMELGKQNLYFVSSRRNAESLADKLAHFNSLKLGKNEKQELLGLSEEILNVLDFPTKQCKKLAECIKNGVAFHHAGLLGKQKSIIENYFKKGLIKSIVATPTLAMGVNLPAFRVIIRDIKRYYSGIGMRYIPVLEYKQFAGRAGRPGYDDFGEAVLIAKSEDEARKLTETYILGEPEDVYSKLSLEPVLRMQTLALIASDFIQSRESLFSFFSKTFYANQYGDMSEIENKLDRILKLLMKFKFLEQREGKIKPTNIGRRVSELYIDPLTAHHFLESLKNSSETTQPFAYLHAIANTLEMFPLLGIGEDDYDEINAKIIKTSFLEKVPNEWEEEYENFIRSVKTAMLLEAWIEEKTEDEILSKFKVTPGELYTRLKNTDWLLYSMNELGVLLGKKRELSSLRKLKVRMKYGAREELLPLLKLEQVGRIRARKLFNSGLKTIEDLKKAPLGRLSIVVGAKIAASIKKQLGEDQEEVKEEKQLTLG